MGGTITSVIRHKDGTTIPMQRWTNSVPWFYQSSRLFTDTDEHISDYMSQWYSMKTDHEKNNKSGQFEFPMTPVYFPSTGFVPDEYGFIVLDLMKSQIISCNHYTNIRTIDMVSLLMSATGARMGEDENDNEFDDFVKLCQQGRITQYLKWNREDKKFDVKDITFYDVGENKIALGAHGIIPLTREYFSKSMNDLMESNIRFIVDYSPMTIYDYEHDLNGITKAFEHVKRDFELSPAELDAWSLNIEEYGSF